ncbi:biotin/lipoyl-containing protein [Xiashengella succiniciproducens]|jgi:biotin carboxyl carrier protein|uniref:Biotin/lipoyl-binding protein n=1 Tax=Xiashengella succiniciproducens TaxID=2949635 RepID=A0A9J6ZT68_9BACT|nr:biotin/lipoyl-containing protein [Alkaliflexus sp. Ai-910]URW80861.1 biotin/lipoyl-binding protein [Alkaliflexus sp. Ai-910]
MKKFDFTINGNRYAVDIKDIEDNIAQVEVNGTIYEVEIHREVKQSKTPRLMRPAVKHSYGEEAFKKKEGVSPVVKSPLPGVVLRINFKEGDEVNRGDSLLVMEAMKMENNIYSELKGRVKSIKVQPGQSVLQGDILMEIE